MAMDEGRSQRLLQSLREIIGAANSEASGSVTINSDGIHVTASKEKQGYVASYLGTLFNESVAAKSEEVRREIPSLQK
jgi:hypothetical protein